jgi:hypothetical protein
MIVASCASYLRQERGYSLSIGNIGTTKAKSALRIGIPGDATCMESTSSLACVAVPPGFGREQTGRWWCGRWLPWYCDSATNAQTAGTVWLWTISRLPAKIPAELRTLPWRGTTMEQTSVHKPYKIKSPNSNYGLIYQSGNLGGKQYCRVNGSSVGWVASAIVTMALFHFVWCKHACIFCIKSGHLFLLLYRCSFFN